MNLKRALALGIVLAAAIVTLVLLRVGGHSNPTVARVGGQAITSDQLAAVVDHFRLEAKREGNPFPDENGTRFKGLRNRLLGVLVYRAELGQAAARLGVRVTNVQVLQRLNGSSEPGEASSDRFQYDSVKAQLLYEGVYARVTSGVTAPTRAQLSARRNEAMSRYVDKLRRETQVRYEPGYAPSP